jgi:hypothetical protein
MRRATRGVIAAIIGVGVTVVGAQAIAAAQAGEELQVIVTYKGKGDVSKANEIVVFLFDNPIINAGSRPIAIRTIEKNGGSAQFTGLTLSPVYVAVAYDDKGTFTPGEGPPPVGTPVSIHGETKPGAGAAPVKTGKGAKLAITFNDAVRMQH